MAGPGYSFWSDVVAAGSVENAGRTLFAAFAKPGSTLLMDTVGVLIVIAFIVWVCNEPLGDSKTSGAGAKECVRARDAEKMLVW